MPLKKYSNAIKRSIRACKKNNMRPKDAADHINTLKCVTKTRDIVTPQAIAWAYRRYDVIG